MHNEYAPAHVATIRWPIRQLCPPTWCHSTNVVTLGMWAPVRIEYECANPTPETGLRGRLASAAMGFSVDRTREAVEAILEEHNQSGPAAVLVSLRYVRGSGATLAFTRFPTTRVLELDGVQSARTNGFYARVWDCLDRQGIPYTFHWGKQHNLDAVRVRQLYGPRVEQWLAARRQLLDEAERRLFANDLLSRLALDR